MYSETTIIIFGLVVIVHRYIILFFNKKNNDNIAKNNQICYNIINIIEKFLILKGETMDKNKNYIEIKNFGLYEIDGVDNNYKNYGYGLMSLIPVGNSKFINLIKKVGKNYILINNGEINSKGIINLKKENFKIITTKKEKNNFFKKIKTFFD